MNLILNPVLMYSNALGYYFHLQDKIKKRKNK